MDFAPLRLERSIDWGWRLLSTGRIADMVRFSSRQLSSEEHRAAQNTPAEIVTLYMRRVGCDSQQGPFGVWKCFRAYQGMMPAPAWMGRQIAIERGLLTITLSANTQETCQCEVDESECTIDVVRRLGVDATNEENMNTERIIYQVEVDGQVLVATRNELPGGFRPAGPPKGLPCLSEIMQDEFGTEALAH